MIQFSDFSSRKPPVFITKTGGLSLHLLFRGNRGQISQIVIFGAIGYGFQVFGITPVGNAHARDLPLLCHGNGFGFRNKGFVGQFISGDPAAFLHKSDDALRIVICLRNLIQCISARMMTSLPLLRLWTNI